MLLRKHAEDLLSMADKITEEFKSMDDILGGDIYFGCAESFQICYLARMIRLCREQYPGLHYHITSGDTEQVTEKLDKGLLDFGIVVEEPNREKYHALAFPEADRWMLVMPEHCELAKKDKIEFEDLLGMPLYCSEQSVRNDLPRWCGERVKELQFEGSFRLAYNGSVFAREGLGYLLTFDKLIDTSRQRPDRAAAFTGPGNTHVSDLAKISGVHAYCGTFPVHCPAGVRKDAGNGSLKTV